jgi:NIPSNAP
MIWQLRTYTIKPGQMDGFVELWSEHITPLRRKLGFEVAGGWRDDDADVFVWIVGHPADDGWDSAEKSYYDDPRRSELPRDPRDFVAEVHTRLLRAV